MNRTLLKGALAVGLLASALFLGTPAAAWAEESGDVPADEPALVEDGAEEDGEREAGSSECPFNSWRFYEGYPLTGMTGESARQAFATYKYWMTWRAANGTTGYSIADTSNTVVATKGLTTGVLAVGIDVSSWQGPSTGPR